MTKMSSCRPALCFNDCGKDPCVGLSSFSLSNVLGQLIVNYKGFVINRGMLVLVGLPHDIGLWSILLFGNRSINIDVITLTLPWDGAPPRKGSPGGEKPRKRESSLSGHWMGHLLSYSLSGGHDGAMPPINPRGLNGPLTSHFIFSSHMYFSLNTPTHYRSPMPN